MGRNQTADLSAPSLTFPILLDPSHPLDATSPLPCRVEHIAVWTSHPTTSPPVRHVALAFKRSVYIHSVPSDPLPSPNEIPPSPALPLPTIKTPDSRTFSPTSSSKRPTVGRTSSAPRSRADSVTSYILTTSSLRRVSAFSPPTSAAGPQAVLTSAQAVGTERLHYGRSTDNEKAELREHLREQRDRDRDAKEPIGLGIGLGRRSIQVHSKDDIDGSGSNSPTGLSKARSTGSFESSRTVGGLRGWLKGEDSEKEKEKELQEKMAEIEVQREIEREVEDERNEARGMEAVERAGSSTPKRAHHHDDESERAGQACVRRIVLRGRKGRIVTFKVFEEVGVLAVLREQGVLDLISLDGLQVTASIMLEQPEPKMGEAGSSKSAMRIAPFWAWRDLHLARSASQAMIVAEGVPWPCAMPSPNGEVTRVVMVSAPEQGEWTTAAGLELPGTGHIGVCEHEGRSFILHFLPHSLTSYPIIFPSRNSSPSSSGAASRAVSTVHPSPNLLHAGVTSGTEKELRRSRSLVSLNTDEHKEKEGGFAKFLAARRPQGPPREVFEETKAGLGEASEVERDGYGDWTSVRISGGDGLGIDADSIHVFRCDGARLSVLGVIQVEAAVQDSLMDARNGRIILRTETGVTIYEKTGDNATRHKYEQKGSLPQATAISLGAQRHLYFADDKQVASLDTTARAQVKRISGLSDPAEDAVNATLLPCGLEDVFVADKSGNVWRQTLAGVLAGEAALDAGPAAHRLESPVTIMKVIQRGSGDDLLVAGDEDGAMRIWVAEPFQLLGTFTAFADPVQSITLVATETKSELQDTLLCTSIEGTIGIISLSELELLYLIPASRAPLRRVFIDAKDILLAYANGKARVWNYKTGEFRRSTGLEAGEDMMANGNWEEVYFEQAVDEGLPLAAADVEVISDADLGRMLLLNLRAVSKWVQTNKLTRSPLPALRAALSTLLTFGTDADIDAVCQTDLAITPPQRPTTVGASSPLAENFSQSSGAGVWSVSPEITGLRQLAIVTLLRPFLDHKETEKAAARVIAFYSGCLSATEPALDFFAAYYLDTASDVQQAAKILFKARLDRMSEAEIENLVAAVRPSLPESSSRTSRAHSEAIRALTIIGGVALHKYQSVNPSVLKATAETIYTALSDVRSPVLELAIELVHSGFQTWQTYLDPMDLLRRLFHLATHNPPPPSVSAAARLAVLHIANLSPGLFMSTLSMDILHAETVEGRTSIMKLCVFMARKKPGVIAHGLPRICEAVVRSLDPNVGKMREDVWEAATVILNELVLAFSTIDFHSGTQRLAVGTHEGAVIMYDLKTASRLYVLEPHHAPVSSVNFSPDGRRLVTVSIEEGDVTVWKVGSSLSGFFTVGGPPRQGGGKGEPFKRIEFIRADNGPLAETSALSDVKVEWPGERQVRVMIQETALTFET